MAGPDPAIKPQRGGQDRYRRDLVRQLELGNHLIKDIGLTLEQALSEIRKPFWRA